MAIAKLEASGLTVIEKITIGKQCKVYQWLKDGYTALVEDPHQFTLKQLEPLGWETLAKVLWVAGGSGAERRPLSAIKIADFTITAKKLSCQDCKDANLGAFNSHYDHRPFYCNSCHENHSEVDLNLDVEPDREAINERVNSFFKDELMEVKLHDEC